jgi:hypothetical protein
LKQLQGIPNPDPRTISEAIHSLVIKIEEFKNPDEILSEQMSYHEIMDLRNKHALIQTKLSSISANIGNSAEQIRMELQSFFNHLINIIETQSEKILMIEKKLSNTEKRSLNMEYNWQLKEKNKLIADLLFLFQKVQRNKCFLLLYDCPFCHSRKFTVFWNHCPTSLINMMIHVFTKRSQKEQSEIAKRKHNT